MYNLKLAKEAYKIMYLYVILYNNNYYYVYVYKISIIFEKFRIIFKNLGYVIKK